MFLAVFTRVYMYVVDNTHTHTSSELNGLLIMLPSTHDQSSHVKSVICEVVHGLNYNCETNS